MHCHRVAATVTLRSSPPATSSMITTIAPVVLVNLSNTLRDISVSSTCFPIERLSGSLASEVSGGVRDQVPSRCVKLRTCSRGVALSLVAGEVKDQRVGRLPLRSLLLGNCGVVARRHLFQTAVSNRLVCTKRLRADRTVTAFRQAGSGVRIHEPQTMQGRRRGRIVGSTQSWCGNAECALRINTDVCIKAGKYAES
jgi:hypothetical protein